METLYNKSIKNSVYKIGKSMKFMGTDAKTVNKGYFGVRRCSECKCLRDVELVEISGKEFLFFIPIKNLGTKRFLVCSQCGAALEVNDDMWHYYKNYNYRFDKKTTDEIINTLFKIETDLKTNNIKLNCADKLSEISLNMIHKNLCKKFDNPKNIEELISVYFTAD